MTLAAMTAVAHAQSSDGPTGKQVALRPPTQGQVGEAWHQPHVAPAEPDKASETRWAPTESQVAESWRHQTDVSRGRPPRAGSPTGA